MSPLPQLQTKWTRIESLSSLSSCIALCDVDDEGDDTLVKVAQLADERALPIDGWLFAERRARSSWIIASSVGLAKQLSAVEGTGMRRGRSGRRKNRHHRAAHVAMALASAHGRRKTPRERLPMPRLDKSRSISLPGRALCSGRSGAMASTRRTLGSVVASSSCCLAHCRSLRVGLVGPRFRPEQRQ